MNIFIYGDSNTAGYIPNDEGYSKDAVPEYFKKSDLWWAGLEKENFVVVNALCGRAVCHENKWLEKRNSSVTFEDDLKVSFSDEVIKIEDVDAFIIMLGTNDLKTMYNSSVLEVVGGIDNLIKRFKQFNPGAEVVIVSPPQIKEGTKVTSLYYSGASLKVAGLNYQLHRYCMAKGYSIVSGSSAEVGEDGEHLTIEGHKLLGDRVFQAVNNINKSKEELERE